MRINDNQLIASELGFSDRQKWVIQYTQLLPNFFQCCYSFSKRLLEADIRYFNREDSILDTSLLMKNLDVDDESRIEPILNQIVDRLKEIQGQNSPETPLIRLGGSKGYFSNTISLILKERNPTMYEKVVSVLSRTPYKFPRTRRVVLSPDGKYDILGWIQLSRQAG
jgi:CRISPR/Cas system CSM-associated protein Csm5 (group 7 of RAMP superfamily)